MQIEILSGTLLCKKCSLIGLHSCLEAPLYFSRPKRVWRLPTTHAGDSPDVTTSTDAPVFQSQLHSNRVTPDNALEIQTSALKSYQTETQEVTL